MPERKLNLWRFTGLLVVFLAGWMVEAATYRRMSLEALIQSSDIVIYGRVVESRAQWDAATGSIWTRTVLLVLDGPKGQAGTTVLVTEPGGTIEERGEFYPGIPQFLLDQEVVLFLYRAPGNRLRVTGLLQGVYTVAADRQTGERLARPGIPEPEMIYEEGSPGARSAFQAAGAAENLSRFLHTIRQKAIR